MDLICVGDVMLDVRVEAGALARGGDVHGRVLIQEGGTSANAAVWAAWDGASSRVLGRVGADLPGRLMGDALRERGVRADLTIDPEVPSGTMLVVHESGDRSMVADRGANARLSPQDLPETLDAGAVLVSGYLLLHQDTNRAAIAALERSNARFTAVEAASWPLVEAFGVERFTAATKTATFLLANEREAQALTGKTGLEAARILSQRYPYACVKLGAAGAIVIAEGKVHQIEAETVNEIDPTGAGDAFDGVLLAALARGAGMDDALARASHAGALVAGTGRSWPEEASREG